MGARRRNGQSRSRNDEWSQGKFGLRKAFEIGSDEQKDKINQRSQ